MTTSYGALCSDFFVNASLGVRMDLPMGRETILDLFTRVRRDEPSMRRLKRYQDEFALESPERDRRRLWMSVRSSAVRCGVVNPRTLEEAADLHRLVMRAAPFYLGVVPIDVDHVEVTLGFDLLAKGNHHAIIREALLAGSPLAALMEGASAPIDIQPLVGVSLSDRCDVQAFVEVKARTSVKQVRAQRWNEDPISVFVSVRRVGEFDDIDSLPDLVSSLAARAERLTQERVEPRVLRPLREAIASSQF